MRTALTDRLGIEHPVLSAGMARVSQADLVAAVGNAGGMGCLGGISYLPEDLRREIRRVRALTDRPFAVDLVVLEGAESGSDGGSARARELWDALSPEQRAKLRGVEPLFTPGAVEDQIAVILEEKPPVLALTFHVPPRVVDECHARGIQVIALVGSVRRAREAVAAGADFVVAQGTEGGGHTGHVGTMALVPAVVDAVDVPVVAAGGIADGRGLAAALCLGAAGVWVGTRFIASEEAYGHAAYKQRVVDATTTDTVLTRSYTGKSLRTLRNEWTVAWEGGVADTTPFPGQYAVAADRVEIGYQDGEWREGMMPAGQGVELVRTVLPAGAIVHAMVADAERILRGGGQATGRRRAGEDERRS